MNKPEIEAIYPLSPMQQGLLFHSLYSPGTGTYLDQMSCQFQGGLDVEAFKQAWHTVVSRHAALRTSFIWERIEEPLQVVQAKVKIPWQEEDWQHLPVSERQASLEQFLRRDRETGFDFSRAPLVRLALIKLGADGYYFVWSSHHVLLDEWCKNLVLKDVFTCYEAFGRGREAELKSPRPYREYIAWLKRQDMGRVEAFWREELKGFTTPTHLSFGRGKQPQLEGLSEEQRISIDRETTDRIKALARAAQTTISTVMQAAWALVLSRYSGQKDVLFGLTVSGRSAPLQGIEAMVGLFINTLPVRVQIKAEETVRAYLKRLHVKQRNTLEFEHSPLAQVQSWSEVPRGTPVFESLFLFQNFLVDESFREQAGSKSLISNVETFQKVNYPLMIVIGPGAEMRLRLIYDRGLFDATDIIPVLEHLRLALKGMTDNAEQRVGNIAPLTPSEQQQIVVEWNDTERDYCETRYVHELIERQVEASPDTVALVSKGNQLSYNALNERANLLAHYLQELGVAAETTVALYLERGPDLIIALLGTLKAGGVYVVLDPSYPAERVSFILEDAKPRALLTDSRLSEKLPAHSAHAVKLDREQKTLARYPRVNPVSALNAKALAYIVYTSGSTGQPKGVCVAHSNLANHVKYIQELYEYDKKQRRLQFVSPGFDAFGEEVFPLLTNGGTLVFGNGSSPMGLAEFLDECERAEITAAHLPSSYWHELVDELKRESRQVPEGLALVVVGGEAPSMDRLKSWSNLTRNGSRWLNEYGPAEATITTTVWESPLRQSDQLEAIARMVVGRPIANARVYILGDELHPSPVGVAGGLYIDGEGLARGYLNRADLTAERFIPNPFGRAGGYVYNTGDAARYLTDGNIELLGRIDHQVKIRGYRIELGEIEAVLAQSPLVEQAVVIVREDEPGRRRLVAYVVGGEKLSGGDLRQYLKSKLPEYMIPSAFVRLETLPLTHSGKLDRQSLPAPTEAASAEEKEGLQTPVEEILAGIFAEVLRLEKVKRDANFFEMGGHSLLATQVVSRVRDVMRIELPLRSLFESPAVAELAEAVERARNAGKRADAPPMLAVSRDRELPLSYAQQRLWFIQQLEPDSAAYNIPLAMRIYGRLDVNALAQSLSEIVRRHEALRTRFEARYGEPTQMIDDRAFEDMPIWDLSEVEEPQREKRASAIAREQSARPFNLEHGPVWRAALVKWSNKDYVLLITFHHVVSDGWSIGLLMKEFTSLYQAYRTGGRANLSELSIQYADFAVWQREWLQGEVLEEQLGYWRRQLAGVPVLELPTDRPRPATAGYNGARVHFNLPPELTRQLMELTRKEGVTLFMTLLAAFQVMLSKYAGQDDVAVGTPIANRNHLETESLVGFFVNQLVLRTHLSADTTLKALLKQVRETTLDAYSHQDLPFEKLVEELAPERDLGRSPLFQAEIVLQNAPQSDVSVKEIAFSELSAEHSVAKFDLTLSLTEGKNNISGRIEYATDLYEEVSIERMARHLRLALEAMASGAQRKVGDIGLLREGEHQQILLEWNDTAHEFGERLCLHEMFQRQVAQKPDAIAVVYGSRRISHAELNARANQLARYLISKGVGVEQKVGIMLQRSEQMIVALIGVLKAGTAYVPLDPSYPAERLNYMLADAGLSALVTVKRLLNRLPAEGIQVIDIDEEWQQIGGYDIDDPQVKMSVDNSAYVIYTSGSTGKPKGVLVQHTGLTNLAQHQVNTFGIRSDSNVLQFSSLSFDASVFEIAMSFQAGATLYLDDKERLLPGPEMTRLLQEQNITTVILPPSVLALLPEAQSPALSTIVSVGEACPSEVVGRWSTTNNFFNAYGPTEATVWSTVTKCFPGQGRPPVGRPINNTQVYILDRDKQVVPTGVAGELCVREAGMTRGYIDQAELTAERFIPNPFTDKPGVRIYRTGDLCKYLPDGNIEFLGRIDDQVKIRGYRIELGEIESVLCKHPGISEAIVVVRDERGDKHLVGYVVPRRPLTALELHRHLQQSVPEYMIPAAWVMLEQMPLSPNGKINKRALPAPETREERGSTAARTPMEEVVAGIWSEVLRVEQIGREDSFFELGGHSLLATQVMSRVREVFDVDLALRVMFERPTVAGLAEAVEQEKSAGRQAEAPLMRATSRDRQLPLSYAQQRLWFIHQLEPDSAAYNVPTAIRLLGNLGLNALVQSLSEISRRHEALRTRFEVRDGQPAQVIDEAHEVKLDLIDISGMQDAKREKEARQIAGQEARRAFDLERGPVLRTALVRLGEQDHVLVMNMHHIASDGWSTEILVREITTLYERYGRGQSSSLEELTVQYADYAAWQREWLQGDVLEEQLCYWREKLEDVVALDLPTDRPRPAVSSHIGDRVPFNLSQELTQELRQLSRREGVTLFMTLLAAFQVVLARYCGQDDVAVGTDVANRNHIETEPLIGFFVNQLVLRTDFSANPSVSELLKQVRETTLEAYQHQDLPFEKLVEELSPERDLSRSPLFQVKLVMQNLQQPAPQEPGSQEHRGQGPAHPPGLELRAFQAAPASIKLAINLMLSDSSRGVTGAFNYATEMFDQTTAQRLAGQMRQTLERMSRQVERRVGELELMSDAERHQVLVEWNDTEAETGSDACVQDLIEQQAAQRPDAVALVYKDERLSYGRMNEEANRLARHLMRMGVGAEVSVGLYVERSLEMVVGVVGVLKAGGAYVPIETSNPLARVEQMLEDAQAAVVLTQQEMGERLAAGWWQVVKLDADRQMWQEEEETNPEAGVSPNNLAYVIYTSGSTGRPKGVGIEHRQIVNYVEAVKERAGLEAGQRNAMVTTIGADLGYTMLYGSLCTGGELHVVSREESRDRQEWERYCDERAIESVKMTPTQVEMVVREEAGVVGKAMVVGGEQCRRAMVERVKGLSRGVKVINHYGPTESTVGAVTHRVEEGEEGEVRIGRPMRNVKVYVEREGRELEGVREEGELVIGGEGVGRGYVREAEKTAERFVPDDKSGGEGRRAYRTGDKVRWGREGELEYKGRVDGQVKVRGYRVEVGEIEEVMSRHAGVKQSVVVAREEGGEKRLVSYVVWRERKVEERELREYLRERLPEYMVPAAIVEMEEMPLTANGKVDRKRLPEPAAKKGKEGEEQEAKTAVEEIVAGIWSAVLRIEEVGIQENFFELGGHSLLATQVMSRVREVMRVELGLRVMFERPTVAELAEEIEQERRAGRQAEAPLMRAARRENQMPVSYAQQRLWFIHELEPESAAYNIPRAVRLEGRLSMTALEQSLTEIVRRHEVLRTRFEAVDGQPVQVIQKAIEVEMPVWDVSQLGEGERDEIARKITEQEAVRRFDLQQGPVLRAALVRLGEQEHVLLMCLHHIASDGWSTEILVREITTLYERYGRGQSSSLEELAVQYADYAVWQREWLQGDVLEEQLSYWREKLAGVSVLELPTDRPRPAAPSHIGHRVPFHLSQELTRELRQLSRREGVTLFMTLLAAFQVVLARYCGQDDVAVGTDVANRNHIETEPLIGFFVNQLVLRTDLSANPTLTALLSLVREGTLDAYNNQDLQFEKLVEDLAPDRDLARHPLFQVTFVFQNARLTTSSSGPTKLSMSPLSNGPALVKFDLELAMWESADLVGGQLSFNAELFEAITITRMAAHLKQFIEQMVSQPAANLDQLSILTPAEHWQLCFEWNDTYSPFPLSDSFDHLFLLQLSSSPDSVAASYLDQWLSYSHLNFLVDSISTSILGAGLELEQTVAVLADRSLELLACFIAILRSGCVYLPVDPLYPVERIGEVLSNSEARVALTTRRLREVLDGAIHSRDLIEVGVIQMEELLEGAGEGVSARPGCGDNLAYVIYTSGSTGKPKGVMIHQRGMINHLYAKIEELRISDRDVIAETASQSFDISIWQMLAGLLVGARVHVVDEEAARDARRLMEEVEKQGVTVLEVVPTMLAGMVMEEEARRGEGEREEEETLRVLMVTGEELGVELSRRWLRRRRGVPIVNAYGPTECSDDVTQERIEKEAGEEEQRVAIGRVLSNLQGYIVDGRGREVVIGIEGELWIGGVGVGRGYYKENVQTAERYVPDERGEEEGGRVYRTGDRARYRRDGRIEYLGRKDEQVKVRGYRIELGEIEEEVNRQEGVRQSVVVVREGEGGEKRLVCYVVGTGKKVEERELRERLRERLPEYMVPSVYVEMEELPLTANGKVDRKRLPEPAAKKGKEGEEQEAKTAVEEIVAGIWSAVLRIEEVGIQENFFELGGHSLLATQVMSRVREVMGVELGLRVMFERPTVAGLAEEIEQERRAGRQAEAPPMRGVSRSERLELSFAQQRLWFIHELEPDSTAYNIPRAVRLEGRLSMTALEQSLTEIVRRHEVLRTRFEAVDGQPLQVIQEASEIGLGLIDISGIEEAKREKEARQIAGQEARRAFDLERGPVLRTALVRLGEQDHVLVMNMHHIASDGWSAEILVREITTLYERYGRGQSSSLEELAVQYADYAVWQREWLQGDVLEQQLSYWREKLAGVSVLDLPTDRPRPAAPSHIGHRVPFHLSQELTRELRQLSRREGVTLFMTLLAAFQVVLARYCGQDDVAVGTDVANRNHIETEPLIGFFVNQLVLRTDFSANPSVRELLKQVRETTLDAYQHQDLPFEKLVEELSPERDLSRSPLFQVKLVMQNLQQPAPQEPGSQEHRGQGPAHPPGLELRAFQGAPASIKLAINLMLSDSSRGVTGAFNYATEMFDQTTAQRLAGQMRQTLERMSRQVERRVGEMEVMSDAERHQVLVEWNDTEAETGGDVCVQELIEQQAAQRPDAVALVYKDERLSYGRMNEEANRLARHLMRMGVGAEVSVGLYVERSLEMVVGVVGVLKAGGAYVPIETSNPLARVEQMLEDAQAAVVLTQQEMGERLAAGWWQVVRLDADRQMWQEEEETDPEAGVSPNNLAYVIYTSGSTGRPKGVGIEHRQIVNYVEAVKERAGLEAGQRNAMVTTIGADLGYTMLYGSLCTGGELHVVSREESRDRQEWEKYCSQRGIESVKMTPTQVEMVVREEAGVVGKVMVVGGEQCRRAMVERVKGLSRGVKVINHYGPTESTVGAVTHRVEEGEEGEVKIGRPMKNVKVYVEREGRRVEGVREEGELVIGGEGVGRGYVREAEKTAERFVPDDKSGKEGSRVYRTGDKVRWGREGELEYKGRVDGQVKVRGYRVEMGEIEEVMSRHEAVRATVVVMREGEGGEKRLVSYVVWGERKVEERELREYLRERLPEYMVPAAIVEMEEMPLTANGKVDRKRLPEPAVTKGREEREEGARTAVEEIVAGIWSEVLRIEEVGIQENFFELGGHSLLATQVMSRVREVMGVELGLRVMFESPTIAGLAEEIEQERRAGRQAEAPPVRAVSRSEGLELSYAQQRLWFIHELEPESAAYNIPRAVRLEGELSRAALQQSLSEIVRRHEVLRTRFEAVDGQPVQVIQKAIEVEMGVWDVSQLGEGERDEIARKITVQEAGRRFDLQRGPVLRTALVRLGEQDHVLVMNMHHIASDGWSTEILVREITTLYKRYGRGESSSLEELAVQYADYAMWQRQWLQGDVLEEQLCYWREKLEDVVALDLPTDRPRLSVASYTGDTVGFSLSADLTHQLRQISRTQGVTLFMSLLAGLQVVLARYADQDDVAVGTDVANRNHLETEPLIGFFVNQLVLRTDLSANPTITELLKDVRETTLEAYQYQDLPFEKLVEELSPERDLSRSPLFQVKLVYQNLPQSRLAGSTSAASRLALTDFSSSEGQAKYDLTLFVTESGQGLTGAAVYARDLFEQTSILNLVSALRLALEAMTTDSEKPASEISLMSEAQRHQVVVEWNETETDFGDGLLAHEMIGRQARRSPDAVAAVCRGEHLSYRGLEEETNRLARYLMRMGVGAEVCVGVYVDRSVELMVGLIAVLKAGGAYVPIDRSNPVQRVEQMIEDAQAVVVLTKQEMSGELAAGWWQVVRLDADRQLWEEEEGTDPEAEVIGENLAYVIYTSGTSGKAKGVMVTQEGLRNYVRWASEAYKVEESSGTVVHTSISFDLTVTGLYVPLMKGKEVRLVGEREGVRAVEEAMEESDSRRLMKVTPGQMKVMRGEGARKIAGVMVIGGEELRWEEVERWRGRGMRMINEYGPTETVVGCSVYEVREGEERGGEERGGVPIGRGIANTQLYVKGEGGGEVVVGGIGELYVGGEGVGRGYVREAEKTAERFVPDDKSGGEGRRAYRTGDKVRWGREGELEYLGRKDDQVKVRGYRIELGEIEEVMSRHAGVKQSVVSMKEDERGEKRLVSYVVREGEGKVEARELREYLRERLPEYMVPSVIVEVEEMPLTANGKVDRKRLPEPTVAKGREEREEVARTAVEEIVAGIWSEVLRIEEVGIKENFFELGGHSLLATQVMSRVREVMGVELGLRVMFERPTVAGLAEEIEQERRAGRQAEAPVMRAARRENQMPVSYAQQRLWFIHELEPESAAYNIPRAVRLEGRLSMTALEQSLSEIVRRHEVLRTRFEAVDGQPLQVIEEASEIELRLIDISGIEEAKREKKAQQIAGQEARRAFDLERGPVLRAALVRLSEQDHVLVMNMHHIASDGWSTEILVREITTLYERYGRGQSSSLEELAVQYADYAVWQREWLQGDVLDQQLCYWREKLAGVNVLELPTDRPRPAAPSHIGHRVPFHLSQELTRELRQLSRREGVTLFMTLLAAFQVVLTRYSGQDDVTVGTDVANRNHIETEPLIGFFVNQLVLRANLSTNPTLRELLKQVRETTLEAYQHQDLPFDKLVHELQPERSLRHTPIFQVLFVMQNTRPQPLGSPTSMIKPFPVEGSTSKFDWVVIVQENRESISGTWQYNSVLFDASTIDKLSIQFQSILEKIVSSPDARLSELEVITMQRPPELKRRPMHFAQARPKTISLPVENLVTTGYLSSEQTLPLVVSPTIEDFDLIEWAATERDFIEKSLIRHGALLFRGFKVEGPAEFERFASTLCPELFGEYGDLPREAIGGKVYASTPYPNDLPILLHNESSHLHRWPMKIWFYCHLPPFQGGETPVADCRSLYRELGSALKKKFSDKGLLYVRNFGNGLDVRWQDFFKTSDTKAVEEFCRRSGIVCEWREGNRLRTKKLCPAVATHPRTGEQVLFNQLQAHHVSCLEQTAREVLISQFGEEGLPRNVYYGDGERIPDEVVDELRELYVTHAKSFAWQQGDIMMVDNMLVAHGRNPFVGPRKILVAMGDMNSATP